MQFDEQVRLGDEVERLVRYLRCTRDIPGAVQGIGEPAHQPVVVSSPERGAGDRLGEQFRRDAGRLADQVVRGADQPVQHPFVHDLGRARAVGGVQELPGDSLRRCARRREGAGRVPVPGGAHRRRHFLVKRRADQRVPEAKAVTRFGEHARDARLVDSREQVRQAAAEHDRQVGDLEVHAEQRRSPQHVAHRAGDETKAVRDHRGQGAGDRAGNGAARLGAGEVSPAGERCRARWRQRQVRTAHQRGDKLGEVERVARRSFGQPEKAAVRPAAGQHSHEVRHRRLGEPRQLDPAVVAREAVQREQVIPVRDRARRPDEQQRSLARRLRQPAPERDARRVGPLQVIDDQDDRPHGAFFRDEREQLLGQSRGHVRAPVGGDLAAEQPDDRATPCVDRRFADLKRVKERQERQRRAELVTGAPEDLAPGIGRGRHSGVHERRLANARFAFDQHRGTAPSGGLS